LTFNRENTEQEQTTIKKNNRIRHIPNINFVWEVQNTSVYKKQDDTHFYMAYAAKKERKKIQIKTCPE